MNENLTKGLFGALALLMLGVLFAQFVLIRNLDSLRVEQKTIQGDLCKAMLPTPTPEPSVEVTASPTAKLKVK